MEAKDKEAGVIITQKGSEAMVFEKTLLLTAPLFADYENKT